MNEKWKALEKPPQEALKEIKGGRTSGMTDINPQWRYRAMTEVYGPCGIGWKWELVKTWLEPSCESEVLAFSEVKVFIKDGDKWSEPIPGIGGNKMITAESKGLRSNDECFKMATTDALSVALKFLGVGSLIYEGQYDSKYSEPAKEELTQKTDDTVARLKNLCEAAKTNPVVKQALEYWLSTENTTIDELDLDERISILNYVNEKIKESNKKGVK